MSDGRHITDAETDFFVLNVTPDFCEVDGQVVPFEIFRDLSPERCNYVKSVLARGVPVLTTDSVIRGLIGNMGKGVVSTVSLEEGNTMILVGAPKVLAKGNPVCRHLDVCLMNGKVC